ncbi:phosphotransferase [Virgibacillus ainsalahensis]
MELIKKVLNSYAVYPQQIEEKTDRLFRISDGHREYALKQSLLSEGTVANWENVYHAAFSQNISSILPVYQTQKGNLYVEMDQSIFYLTPWIEASAAQNRKQIIENLYQSIGNVHAKTKKSVSVSTENLASEFNTFKAFCENTHRDIFSYVQQFEKNRYMSPFELLVCTHYRDLEYATKEIKKRIDQLTNKKEEKTQWNYSLCHGNLKFSHLLHGNQSFLINWENAYYDNAVMDLASFLNNETLYYDQPGELLIEMFSTYYKENELTKDEFYLLIIYLLNPANYLKTVQQYVNNTTHDTMINRIIKLQHAYRRLLFGLHWSRYVEEEYESITLEDLEN